MNATLRQFGTRVTSSGIRLSFRREEWGNNALHGGWLNVDEPVNTLFEHFDVGATPELTDRIAELL